MTSADHGSEKFRIEGSGPMLEALARAIELALRAARATPYRTGTGSVAHDLLTIEVEASPNHNELMYVITSVDDAVKAIEGWADEKRCDECKELVALLFDDAYLETRDGNGVICCECYRRIEDGEEETQFVAQGGLMPSAFASRNLKVGEVYSRKSLGKIFHITDATLNTGVFKPKDHSSVWLFVTRKKAANQPKYVDYIAGDMLHWQGQSSGKSDLMIIEHKIRDLELLLFYRDEPRQHADSGFRYMGQLEYVAHKAGHPTSFTLRVIDRNQPKLG
jgi:hypothetical protein